MTFKKDDKQPDKKGYDNGVGVYVQQQAITLAEYHRRMKDKKRNYNDNYVAHKSYGETRRAVDG